MKKNGSVKERKRIKPSNWKAEAGPPPPGGGEKEEKRKENKQNPE